jgi:hypothetical protein
MSDAIELAYGLLWHDRPTEARAVLLALLDKAGQARGIDAARAKVKPTSGDLPPRVADAVKHLRDYEEMIYAYAHDEDDGEVSAVKVAAARYMLEEWAKA